MTFAARVHECFASVWKRISCNLNSPLSVSSKRPVIIPISTLCIHKPAAIIKTFWRNLTRNYKVRCVSEDIGLKIENCHMRHHEKSYEIVVFEDMTHCTLLLYDNIPEVSAICSFSFH